MTAAESGGAIEPPQFLTLVQLAALRGYSVTQCRHAVRSGALPATTVGRAYVVSRADADAWPGPRSAGDLDAYWRARGKRGKPEAVVGSGAAVVYAPALVRMLDGYIASAEVLVSGAAEPDEIVDFQGFKAKKRGTKSGGAWLYDEVN